MVPYAATRDSELAVVRWSAGTRLGTDASLAGVHSSVKHSSTSDATTSPTMVSTKGRVTSTAARPTLHQTMTFLRSKRSAMTPDAAPRKKPGTMRADMTTPTAAAADPAPGTPEIGRAACRERVGQSV